ncbi:hypothetical protein NDU88_003819 [Pleurodeles waltl]|uniref:Uncharacterized protein n=1 Tax=Pleurodeles waltl TaxID=8319 RepID=A0AAV7TQT1_PLEWA|nr:hypothetical protein NDU88_003819 [Pleurodeles waltl]
MLDNCKHAPSGTSVSVSKETPARAEMASLEWGCQRNVRQACSALTDSASTLRFNGYSHVRGIKNKGKTQRRG